MKSLRRLGLVVSLACLLAAPVLGAGKPPAGGQNLSNPLAGIDQQLHRGEWEAAAAAAQKEIGRTSTGPFAPALALAVSRLALAEAGLGREAEAAWHWQVAQNLDRDVLSRETLASFGPAGALLARHGLRAAGQPPADLAVRTLANLMPRRLPAMPLELSPEVRAFPAPKWLRAQLVIDAAGRPRDPVVLGGGPPGAIYEILEAARGWLFEPVQVDGTAVPVFYQLSVNPPAGKPLAGFLPQEPLLARLEEQLRAGGRWEETRIQLLDAWNGNFSRTPKLDRHALAVLLTLQALAEAGSRREQAAICRWQAAQTLDPDIYHADFSAYGAPGALLARNRWGEGLPDVPGPDVKVKAPKVSSRPISPVFGRLKAEGASWIAGIVDAQGGLRQPLIVSYAFPVELQQDLLKATVLSTVCDWTMRPAEIEGRPVATAQILTLSTLPAMVSGLWIPVPGPTYKTPSPGNASPFLPGQGLSKFGHADGPP